MIFFSAYLIALAYKAENLKTWIKVIFRVALCLFCVSSIISYAWPEYSDYFKSQKDSLANLHDSNEFFVRNLQKCREDIPKQILSTQAGPIIMEGIQLSMMRSNPNIAIRWHMGAFIRTADAFRYTYPIFDWVLLQDPGMKGSSPNMPSEAVLPEFRAVISADQNYKVHAEYVDPDGKRITIYSRTGRNQTAE